MNTLLSGRWDKFKQELPSIALVSALSIILSFRHPIFAGLTAPWNTVVAFYLSAISVICTVFLFSFADQFARYFNLDYLNNGPYGHILKKAPVAGLFIGFHIGIFFMWYTNLFHMSNARYVAVYANCLITALLFYKAMFREVKKQ